MSESPLSADHDEINRLELIISHLLRIGVMVAGSLLAIGWIWMWLNGRDISQNLRDYNPQAFTDTLQWAFIMKDRAVLMSLLGLVFLVMLPVIRVFLTAVLFLWQKEFRLALMAFLVFAALVVSFSLGIDI